MKLTNILKEIVVRKANVFSPDIAKNMDIVFDSFGESHSGFKLYAPMTELRTKYDYGDEGAPNGEWEPYDDEENYPEYKAFKYLTSRFPGIYVSSDLQGIGPCPGAPDNAYYIRLEIDPTYKYYGNKVTPSLLLSIPYVTEDLEYVGWFDKLGKYYADTTHFDENGNRIA
jgi:hypothetical protein